ncbi:larval/pupal cuticle protein H1C-like [Diabrotica virgifera virgifera]|uniref:Larval/pupal cuticle protein H1C-like isoform X1 n=2 Tax=Diabrotica virgifera virgifera TaxID=50390 RepID=A0A6P7FGM6_DIAVI|nr:larval/pupal cuticle protein H1C-like [Diabrotica virgifera virgifera]
MYKLIVLAMVLYTVSAGVILDHKPAVIVHHGATSHQNSNSLSVHPVPVVAHKVAVAHVAHAPVIAHAPIAVAHAPVAVAHAPVLHHAVLHH